MPVNAQQGGFVSPEAAAQAFAEQGLHVLSLDVPAVKNGPHWHHFDSEFYIVSGHLALTDAENDTVLDCPAGTWVSVPGRALHAEFSEQGYAIVLGTSVPAEAFGDPVDLPPEAL